MIYNKNKNDFVYGVDHNLLDAVRWQNSDTEHSFIDDHTLFRTVEQLESIFSGEYHERYSGSESGPHLVPIAKLAYTPDSRRMLTDDEKLSFLPVALQEAVQWDLQEQPDEAASQDKPTRKPFAVYFDRVNVIPVDSARLQTGGAGRAFYTYEPESNELKPLLNAEQITEAEDLASSGDWSANQVKTPESKHISPDGLKLYVPFVCNCGGFSLAGVLVDMSNQSPRYTIVEGVELEWVSNSEYRYKKMIHDPSVCADVDGMCIAQRLSDEWYEGTIE